MSQLFDPAERANDADHHDPLKYLRIGGNLFEGVMASVIFYEKEENRTLIEFRGRNNILNYGDSLAKRLEEKFVKPCLRRTEE